MKIAWVQKYHDKNGIEEKTSRQMCALGSTLGFDIVGISQRDFRSEILIESDLIIISNLIAFNEVQRKTIKYVIFEIDIPYVALIFDDALIGLNKKCELEFMSQYIRMAKQRIYTTPLLKNAYKEHFFCDGKAFLLTDEIHESWHQDILDKFVEHKKKSDKYEFWKLIYDL